MVYHPASHDGSEINPVATHSPWPVFDLDDVFKDSSIGEDDVARSTVGLVTRQQDTL